MSSKQHSFNAEVQVTMIPPTALSQSDGQLPQLCNFLGENEDKPLDIIGLSHYTFFKGNPEFGDLFGATFSDGMSCQSSYIPTCLC
jgi:hypothetical protein